MLAKAWACVLEQFPILTARIIEKEGELYHQLDHRCKTTIQQRTIDFANDQELVSFVRKQAMEPFDLNRGPLTRIELFVRDSWKSVLLITVHHIVFDGPSGIILARTLFELYRRLLDNKAILRNAALVIMSSLPAKRQCWHRQKELRPVATGDNSSTANCRSLNCPLI